MARVKEKIKQDDVEENGGLGVGSHEKREAMEEAREEHTSGRTGILSQQEVLSLDHRDKIRASRGVSRAWQVAQGDLDVGGTLPLQGIPGIAWDALNCDGQPLPSAQL